ncbi:hypothetical protein LWI29_025310 [Acer saccharum]|uniref:Pectinesterase catalytic domain-containing protein n=1 Tax=Acer saccharum TaxID=4024 RepID=A0AA39RE85_ACESA|nr:hypothetical protein LWI29_025310 [Acer saccharum]
MRRRCKRDSDRTTFRSATLAVSGDGFLARDVTVENSAGPEKHQAVALRVNADDQLCDKRRDEEEDDEQIGADEEEEGQRRWREEKTKGSGGKRRSEAKK